MTRWIDQQLFGEGNGDCFRAVICSLLGIDDEGVPNFCVDGEKAGERGWFCLLSEWLDARGLAFMEHEYNNEEREFNRKVYREGQLAALAGTSPRGDFLHAVVGKFSKQEGEFLIVHDPHQSREGLVGSATRVGFLLCKDPAVYNFSAVSRED